MRAASAMLPEGACRRDWAGPQGNRAFRLSIQSTLFQHVSFSFFPFERSFRNKCCERTFLQFDSAGADTEFFHLDAILLPEFDHQIGQRRFLGSLDVAVALHLAGRAARNQSRNIQP